MDGRTNNILILKRYALENIQSITQYDKRLIPLVELLRDSRVNLVELPEQKRVEELTNWADAESASKVFSDEEVSILKRVIVRVLEIAKDPASDNDNLCQVTEYLYPLLSQDERFMKIGWDLREYMDWYFKNTSQDEREKYARELQDDWGWMV